MTTGKDRWQKAIAADFLESSAASFAAPYLLDGLAKTSAADDPGTLIGRYRLVREIGRGGMGTVWLAARADGEFEQQLALKLIKRGMDSDEILARFLRERQILAHLEHPNIARLYDGGVAADGRPYFVMEHVPGVPITAYCDTQRLGIEERLELFSIVCRAVQHAHQNLVVHRDIKPSNVLVTDKREVKLLDFGVAKLLGGEDTESTTLDEGSRRKPMTPEYASPEQLAGDAVTTSSDVYQLGVLLHELLTGRRPRRPGGSRSPESDPYPPSSVVVKVDHVERRDGAVETIEPAAVSDRRSSTPDRLRRRLRGDLDTITLRALRTEHDQRYPSAEALAEDVERHLSHLPIRFGGNAWRYRAGKFVRRYRVQVVASSLLVAAAVAVSATYVVEIRAERDRARREAEKGSATAAMLRRFFQGWSPDAADRGQVSAGKVLADATLRARGELGRDPELLGATLSMLGDLHAALGQTAVADSLLTQALTVQETLNGAPSPSTDLAATLERRGRLLHTMGREQESEALARRALAAYQAVLPPGRMEILRSQFALSDALIPQEKLSEAEAVLRDALRASPIEDAPFTTELASQLGYVLVRRARYAEATVMLRRALSQQLRIFGRVHQSTLKTMRSLGASLRGPESLPEAEQLRREALAITQALYGELHNETHDSRLALAVLLERKGDFAEAEGVARAALRDAERLFGANTLFTAYNLRTLGGILLVAGRREEAEVVLRRSRATFRRAAPSGHVDEGDVLNRLAYVLVERHASDAAAIYRQAAEFDRARSPSEPYFVTDGYEYLGMAARQMNDRALAEQLFRRAVKLYDGELPDGHPYRAQSHAGLAQTLLDAGRAQEAEVELTKALEQWQAARPAQPERIEEIRKQMKRVARIE